MFAPFDISKSPKKEIETSEDYRAIARSCFRDADYFHRLSFYPVFLGDIDDISGPAVAACLAFASELFIKSLLYFHQIRFRRVHHLDGLYRLLPDGVQEDIFKKHPMTYEQKTRERFELCLYEVGKTFETVRYMHERSSMTVQYQFLFELALTLHFIAEKELSIESNGEEGLSAGMLEKMLVLFRQMSC